MTDVVEFEVVPSRLSVSIGMPAGYTVPLQTAMSLARTTATLAAKGVECQLLAIAGSSIVTVARNRVAHSFLTTGLSRLFWIDSDITWEPNDFLKLLIMSSQVDVVCATYPFKNTKLEMAVNHHDLTNFEISKYGLLKIKGAGLGFTVVTREAFEKLAATKPTVYDESEGKDIAEVFRLDHVTNPEGRRCGRGEDMAFFADMRELGYDVWLDPRIKLGHVGSHVYKGDPVAALRLEHVYRPEAA